MSNNKLLIVGPYLSTKATGGVSMHVQRLINAIKETTNVLSLLVCDYKQDSILLQIKKILKADIIHLHASNVYLRMLYVQISRLFHKKIIITIHGNLGRGNQLYNLIEKRSIKLADIPIAINEESFSKALMINANTRFISAFLPPSSDEDTLKEALRFDLHSLKGASKQIFATNASRRTFTKDGEEIYGIDFLISFFKGRSNNILVISDPENHYKPLYEGQELNNIYFINYSHSFYAVMRFADFVIRATATDGDSLSVKEALYQHKKTIVTDRVSRPEGVFLFKYNDSDSFEKAINVAASHQEKINLRETNTAKELIDIYQDLCGKRNIL